MNHYTGGCLCGGIQYEIHGELAPVQICHCQQCRKAQGSALVTNIPVSTDQFSLLTGEDLLASYESSPGKERVFCRCCGSPIFSRLQGLDVVRIRAGTTGRRGAAQAFQSRLRGFKGRLVADYRRSASVGRRPIAALWWSLRAVVRLSCI